MTLKEKIGQIRNWKSAWSPTERPVHSNQFCKIAQSRGEYGVFHLNVNDEPCPNEKWHEIIRAIQEERRNSRLQIPVLYGIDSIHGRLHRREHSFSPAARDGATWNRDDAARSQISAAETRKAGIHGLFAVLDAGRQPLWPRLWETFGRYLSATVWVWPRFAVMKEAIFLNAAAFLLR